MPPLGPIVTIERVSYWDKHFDDLMERAVKRMYILRVCKRNGYSVSDLDYLFISKGKNVTNLIAFPNISTNFNDPSSLQLSVSERAMKSDASTTFRPVICAKGHATVIFVWHDSKKRHHADPRFHDKTAAA